MKFCKKVPSNNNLTANVLGGEELERYSRSIILPQIGIEGQMAFKNAKVFVLGCGGVASGLLPLLASSGVGVIALCDFDKIELSNLQRQHIYKSADIGGFKASKCAKLIKAINGNIEVNIYKGKFNEKSFTKYKQIIQNYDVIIDTTDTFASRSLANKICIELQKPLFGGAAIGFDVQIYIFNNLGGNFGGGCYRCIFENPQDTQTCANSGVFPPSPTIAGSMLCGLVLNYILLGKNFAFFNTLFTFNLLSQNQKAIAIKKDEYCVACK